MEGNPISGFFRMKSAAVSSVLWIERRKGLFEALGNQLLVESARKPRHMGQAIRLARSFIRWHSRLLDRRHLPSLLTDNREGEPWKGISLYPSTCSCMRATSRRKDVCCFRAWIPMLRLLLEDT